MKPFQATPGEATPPPADSDKSARGPGGSAIALLLLLLAAALIIMDYSDIVFAESRRRGALELIKPGMRLTQAERTLNGAGYVTLYIDESPPLLQVSSLSRLPFTATLLHKILPNSPPDRWVLSQLSGLTRFYIVGDTGGMVEFRSGGNPMFVRPRGNSLSRPYL